jgi:pyridoxine 5-phosphate synthase
LQNVAPIAQLKSIYELNIGHALIADSVFVGLTQAVQAMKQVIRQAEQSLTY